MKVYEAVDETLRRFEVDTAFGLIGSGNFKLVNYMVEASRYEEGAVAMADGYARVSGRLGVCTVHQVRGSRTRSPL